MAPSWCTVTPSSSPRLAEANDIERRAFEQTNLVRVQHGLPALEWDADVCRMARTHSESMSRLNYFSHDTPDGLHLRDRARAVRPSAATPSAGPRRAARAARSCSGRRRTGWRCCRRPVRP